jgi:excisionase family DNA binding protein
MILLTRDEAWLVLQVLERAVDAAEKSGRQGAEAGAAFRTVAGKLLPDLFPTNDAYAGSAMSTEPTISTLEAAERLGMEPTDVYRMIDEGRLTASWNGQRLVVPVSDIEAVASSTL